MEGRGEEKEEGCSENQVAIQGVGQAKGGFTVRHRRVVQTAYKECIISYSIK